MIKITMKTSDVETYPELSAVITRAVRRNSGTVTLITADVSTQEEREGIVEKMLSSGVEFNNMKFRGEEIYGEEVMAGVRMGMWIDVE